MIAFLRALVPFLAANVPWRNPDTSDAITWVLGDYQSISESSLQLPIGIVTLGVDQIKAHSGGVHGVDMHTYTIPIWIVNTLEQFTGPAQVANSNPPTYEAPDAGQLAEATESTIATLRANLTAAGAALINEPKAEYGRLPMPGGTVYRAARFIVVAQQRVNR